MRPGMAVTPRMVPMQPPRRHRPPGADPAKADGGRLGGGPQMNFPRFFNRPILAIVLSVLMLITGAISYFQLPLSEYPQVTPPTVQVTASYPGANPQ